MRNQTEKIIAITDVFERKPEEAEVFRVGWNEELFIPWSNELLYLRGCWRPSLSSGWEKCEILASYRAHSIHLRLERIVEQCALSRFCRTDLCRTQAQRAAHVC